MRGQKNTGEVKKQGGGIKKTRAPYTFIKYHAPVRRNHAPVQRNTSCIIIGPKISYIYIYTYVYIYIYIYIYITIIQLLRSMNPEKHRIIILTYTQMKNPFSNTSSNLSNIFHNNIHRKKGESLKVRSTKKFFPGSAAGAAALNKHLQNKSTCAPCSFTHKKHTIYLHFVRNWRV